MPALHFNLNILSKANSFLQSRNLSPIPVENFKLRNCDAFLSKYASYLSRNEDIDNVAPCDEQLDKLLFHTIFNSVYLAFKN